MKKIATVCVAVALGGITLAGFVLQPDKTKVISNPEQACSTGIHQFVSTKFNEVYSQVPLKDMVFHTEYMGYKQTPLSLNCYTQVTVRMKRVHTSQTRSVQDAFLIRTMLINDRHEWQLTISEQKGIAERLMWLEMVHHELRASFLSDTESATRSVLLREAIKLSDVEKPISEDVKL